MTSAIDEIFARVLPLIRPAEKDLLPVVSGFLKQVNALLKDMKINATAVIGGSIAKGTFLKDDHDCDIFVKFNPSYPDEKLSDLLAVALKSLSLERVHGSRDYFHVDDAKHHLRYELVPVLDISDPAQARNVTDMSPLHVAWVKKHAQFADDIRLAKQFCKASGVYGAESFIKGFSGHVLDILVIHYRGFENLLKASLAWKPKEVIDVVNYYKGTALKRLNPAKIESPIIVIDPVLHERNAAAVLSTEKLHKFVKAAQGFLARPETLYFEIKNQTPALVKKKAGKNPVVLLCVSPVDGKTDVVGAKILWIFTHLKRALEEGGFQLLDADWSWDKKSDALLWYILERAEVAPVKKHPGPQLSQKKRVIDFKAKHKKTFVEGDRIYTYLKRPHTKAKDLVTAVIAESSIAERTKQTKML
ncbi:CCA tRNA nucleotidyltransferase [Candidatus Woesearchaeota archaeon]|nr:CCA tRNA nucleotidyltransferase [Candidatus Woesearchaeota archaeon]